MIKTIRFIHTLLNKNYFRSLIPLVWMLILVYLSFADFNNGDKNKMPVPFFDKLVHFVLYFVLTYILLSTKLISIKRYNLIVIVFAIMVGIITEILQEYVFTYRSGNLFDLIMNIIGIFSANFLNRKVQVITNL